MKHSRRCILGIGVLVVIAALGFLMINPLRRSDRHIKNDLLRHTPMGASMTDVKGFINSKGWRITDYREDIGFFDQRRRPNAVVGKKHIRAELGQYQGIPFRTHVTVFWGFDEQSRLIDV